MIDHETSRLSRLTAILTNLQSKRLTTSTELASKFNVSKRTVYRDIRALQEAGIPVYSEEGRGYSLISGYRLPPVMFTESEANALVTAEKLILKNKDASLVNNYLEAITKIKAILRHDEKGKAELLSKRILFRQNAKNQITSSYLSTIQLAITNFNLVTIQYRALGNNEITERFIEPFAMYHTHENWVLIAWCRLRQGYRAFRLDRIIQLKTHQGTFEPHDYSLQKYFDDCREKLSENP